MLEVRNMDVAVNDVFFSDIQEEGTVMDYVDGAFIFVIKDEMWTEYEIKGNNKKPIFRLRQRNPWFRQRNLAIEAT